MGIVVDEVVEPPRAQAIAGDDAAVVARLAATGDHAGLDELYDPVGYDVTVDADVATVPEMTQRLVGNAPEPDLQGRAVVDDRSDVTRDALRDLADLGMAVLRHGRVDLHERIEASEMNEALTVSARHRRVDLGDHAAGDTQNRGRKVHGHTETDVASGIGRRHLKQGHVDRQPSARQEFRHLLERNRHVVELAACGEALYVAADEERPMAVAGLGGARLHRQRRRGDEAHELEVGQAGLHPLQPREQAARRSAPGAEIDAAARLDRRQRLLQANELRVVVSGFLTGHGAHLAPYPTFPRCRSLTVEFPPSQCSKQARGYRKQRRARAEPILAR